MFKALSMETVLLAVGYQRTGNSKTAYVLYYFKTQTWPHPIAIYSGTGKSICRRRRGVKQKTMKLLVVSVKKNKLTMNNENKSIKPQKFRV